MKTNFTGKLMNKITLLSAAFLLLGAVALRADATAVELLKFCRVVEDGAQNSEALPYLAHHDGRDTISVEKAAAIDIKDIEEVFAYQDPNPGRGYVISVKFTDEGGKKFANVTKELVGKRLAIVVKNKVVSAPNIMEAINGGSAEISGNFSEAEAKGLAAEISKTLNK